LFAGRYKHLLAFKAVALSITLATSAHAALVIGDAKTFNVKCKDSTCTSTAADAELNVTDLVDMLSTGDVTVISASRANDIVVLSPVSWSTPNQLILQSHRSISVGSPITIAGTGGISLTIDTGAVDGTLSFGPDGSVQFSDLSGRLEIGGQLYTLVNSVTNLASAISSQPSGRYAFAASYDATKDGTYSTSPIASFSGTLEGLGNTISNLTVNDPGSSETRATAFFASLTKGAVVRDFRLTNANFTGGNRLALGGIAGENYGTITQSNVTGTLTGEGQSAGGIAGDNYAKIEDCEFDGAVTGTGWLGGVVGFNHYINTAHGKINGVRATGSVIGLGGGVVGLNEGIVSQSSSASNVTSSSGSGNGAVVGGFVAENYGPISTSFATGNVSVSSPGVAGGFAGLNRYAIEQAYATGNVVGGFSATIGGFSGDNDGGLIENAYAMGSVDGGSSKGGLVGLQGQVNQSGILTSYSTGRIGSDGQDGSVGGFIGFYGYPGLFNVVKNSYWDIQTSRYKRSCGDPTDDCRGIEGLKTKGFLRGLPKGFGKKIWAESLGINGGYPYLKAVPPPS